MDQVEGAGLVDIGTFVTGRLPRIRFGAGGRREIGNAAATYGRRALLVTGRSALRQSEFWPDIEGSLQAAGIEWQAVAVGGEPSPDLVDDAVRRHGQAGIDMVIGLGGGSAMDAAKAIAGLLPSGASVMDYLEGVGRGVAYTGPAVPWIAVPTTAGTGSEATKNAVISRIGRDGFKKSFRDDQLVAEIALVDPDLLATCPRAVAAANATDALTQLIESFVSANANPITDALAWSGLVAVGEGLRPMLDGDPAAAAAGRSRMAYAALISGICLAQAGLGSVHGLASPLGATSPIPHGVACGTLLAEATEINIAALRRRLPDSPALEKYARLGSLFGTAAGDDNQRLRGLVAFLRRLTDDLGLARLGGYGITAADIPDLVAAISPSSMRTNPVSLTGEELDDLLRRRL